MSQYYPPDNGKGEISFNKWYVDDIAGTMHSRRRIVRDYLLRVVKDYNQDEFGRDELIEGYPRREEREVEPPE